MKVNQLEGDFCLLVDFANEKVFTDLKGRNEREASMVSAHEQLDTGSEV